MLTKIMSNKSSGMLDMDHHTKKQKLDMSNVLPIQDEAILSHFFEWCKKNEMFISKKVKVATSHHHRFGMMSISHIKESEILFEIPRSMLLWEENYSKKISSLALVKSDSGWVKLLLILMLEYTSNNSSWMPYLKFAPSPEILDTPIFWSGDVRHKLLSGTSLADLVETDLKNIEMEYKNIALPFIEEYGNDGFDCKKHTFELYKHMVGFLMAYSFTEPCEDSDEYCPPKMVPMADVLNHVSKNNAHLQFDQDSLKMVAICDIPAHTEIFNTYGHLSNSQLLQMYGYVEKLGANKYDSVDIPIDYFKIGNKIPYLEKKWKYLFNQDEGVLYGCDVITVGVKGILSCDEAELIFKVLSMSESEFDSCSCQDWESDSSSDSSSSTDSIDVISFRKISSSRWKDILKCACEKLLTELKGTLQEKEQLEFAEEQNKIRKMKVVVLIKDQISIIQNLIRICS